MSKFVRDENLKLGDDAKDQISGFKGTIVAITEWLNGCRRITIAPSKLHKGSTIGHQAFDAEQVELVKACKPLESQPTGGPAIEPERCADPV